MEIQTNSLKNKIFFFFLLLLVLVQAISFFSTNYAKQQEEQQRLASQLNKADSLLKNVVEKQQYYLTAFAETAAKDSDLQHVLINDNRNLRVSLNNYRKQIDADIAIAINSDAEVLAELKVQNSNSDIKRLATNPQSNYQFKHPQWLTENSNSVYYQLEGEVYQLTIAPVSDANNTLGYVGFGYSLNEKWFTELATLTGFDVGLGLHNNNDWQWLSAQQIKNRTVDGEASISPLITAANNNYAFSNTRLGVINNTPLVATIYHHKLQFNDRYNQYNESFMIMIAVILFISLLGAYVIASSVTKPLRRLVKLSRNITKGKYSNKINVGNTKELNQLAEQFADMQQAIKSREKAITEQAYLDNLTALPNRNQFYRDMHDFELPFVLCQLNIRRLADFNDTLGHDVGDKVIQEVANRLKVLTKPLYHTSGNCFLIRFDEATISSVKACISALNEAIEPSFNYQNIALHLQVNIGVTVSVDWPQANQLLKEVDSAMQIAKRDNILYQLYDRQIDLNTLDRLQLVNRLKIAIENNEFTLYYQPKLNLKNSKVEQVEALVRWQHPVNGLISPDSFIHIAEQTGQMTALSLWVINEAIAQYFAWQAKGIEIKIAINISPENLLNDDFCQLLVDKLCGKRTLNKALSFEITEDAFVDHSSKAVANINKLRAHNIYLSIDDYGTGYSSLAQLKNLSVQELKIDKSFIQKLMVEPVDQLIVSSTIQLSHQLGLSVVAEGVEDKLTLAWLKELNCDKAQGYFISRPLPANDFYHWLQSSEYGYLASESINTLTNEETKVS
ncbi:EAL domain-containing protein [Colwelliaceae bacterium BS250]